MQLEVLDGRPRKRCAVADVGVRRAALRARRDAEAQRRRRAHAKNQIHAVAVRVAAAQVAVDVGRLERPLLLGTFL
jgi:hypothetical protein